MFRTLTVACVLACCSYSAMADVVVMNNGDRLTGKVDGIIGGKVLLITEYAGAVNIDMSAVSELTTEEAFNVSVDGARVEGQFSVDEGQQSLVSEEEITALDLANVRSAGQSNLSLVAAAREWKSRVDLTAASSRGNSDTESFNAFAESILKRDRSEHGITVLLSREEAQGEITKRQFDFDYGYKHFISERWFALATAEYFEDELKEIDQRISLGGGMGYQFWDNSFGAFSTELGVTAVLEELDGERENNPAIRWGLDYRRYLLAKRLEVFHNQSLLVIPDSDRGEVLTSSTGLRFALSDSIDATFRVDLNHETDPPADASRTDVTYGVGVGIRF